MDRYSTEKLVYQEDNLKRYYIQCDTFLEILFNLIQDQSNPSIIIGTDYKTNPNKPMNFPLSEIIGELEDRHWEEELELGMLPLDLNSMLNNFS